MPTSYVSVWSHDINDYHYINKNIIIITHYVL